MVTVEPTIGENIHYLDIDESWRERIAVDLGEKAARHMHFANGFTIMAMHQEQPVGLISSYWRELSLPLPLTVEAYIDFLEVRPDYRRHGIARQLIELSVQRACEQHVYQVRSCCSEDKLEAIPMWKQLGFGLCPATTFPNGKEVREYYVTKILIKDNKPNDKRNLVEKNEGIWMITNFSKSFGA